MAKKRRKKAEHVKRTTFSKHGVTLQYDANLFWCVSVPMAAIISEMLDHFIKSDRHGIPQRAETIENWEKILVKMRDGFHAMATYNDLDDEWDEERNKETLRLFGIYFNNFWD